MGRTSTIDQFVSADGWAGEAGCDDVVLLPCDAASAQVELLAEALDGLRAGA